MSADVPRIRVYSETQLSPEEFAALGSLADRVTVWELGGGPTMTVDIPAGDPDDPTWTDLDVR